MRSHMRSPMIRNHKIQSMNSARGRCARMGKCKCCWRCSLHMKVVSQSNDSASSYFFLTWDCWDQDHPYQNPKGAVEYHSDHETATLMNWTIWLWSGLRGGWFWTGTVGPSTDAYGVQCVSQSLPEMESDSWFQCGRPLRAFHNLSPSCLWTQIFSKKFILTKWRRARAPIIKRQR